MQAEQRLEGFFGDAVEPVAEVGLGHHRKPGVGVFGETVGHDHHPVAALGGHGAVQADVLRSERGQLVETCQELAAERPQLAYGEGLFPHLLEAELVAGELVEGADRNVPLVP